MATPAAELEASHSEAAARQVRPLVPDDRIPPGLPRGLSVLMDLSPGSYPAFTPEESLDGLAPLPTAIALIREIKYPHPKERFFGEREETRENRIRNLVTAFHQELSYAVQERNTDVGACHSMLRMNIQYLIQTALIDQDIQDGPIRQQLMNLAIGIADDTSSHMRAYLQACGGNFRENNRFPVQADVTEAVLTCYDWLRMNGRIEEANRIVPMLVHNFEFNQKLLERNYALTTEETQEIEASISKEKYRRNTEFGSYPDEKKWQKEVNRQKQVRAKLKYQTWLSRQPLIAGVTPFVVGFTDTILTALRTHALHTGIQTVLLATDNRLQYTPTALLREMLFAVEGGAEMRIKHPETWVGLLYELATVINPNISLMIAELAGDPAVTKQLAKALARVGILDKGALKTYDVVFRDFAALYRGPQEVRVRPQTTFVHGNLASFCPIIATSIRNRYRVGPGQHDKRFLATYKTTEVIEQGSYEPLMYREGESGSQAALFFLQALMNNLEADWNAKGPNVTREVRVFEMLNILLLRSGMEKSDKAKRNDYKGSVLEKVDNRIADFIITELTRVIQAEEKPADSLVLNLLQNVGYFLPTSLKGILLDRAVIQADKTSLFADSPSLWKELVNAVGFPHAYLEITEPDQEITAKVLEANVAFLRKWKTDPACMARSDRWLALQITTAAADFKAGNPSSVGDAINIASLYGSTSGLEGITAVLLEDIRRYHLWSIKKLPRLVPPEPVIAIADTLMNIGIIKDAERRIAQLKEELPEVPPELLPDSFSALLAESVAPYEGASLALQHFATDLSVFDESTGAPSEVLEKLVRDAELGMPEPVRSTSEFQNAQAEFEFSGRGRGNYLGYLMTLRMMESLGTTRASALQPLEGLLRQLQAMGEFEYTHEVQKQAVSVISASVKTALEVIKGQEEGSRAIIRTFIEEHQDDLKHLLKERKDALKVIHDLEAAVLTRQQEQVKAQVDRQLKYQQAQLGWLGEVEKANQEVAGIVRSLREIVEAANYHPPVVDYQHLTAEEIELLMSGKRLPEEEQPRPEKEEPALTATDSTA